MPLPHPSPIERHILDLLDRIERMHSERIEVLEARVGVLEARNEDLTRQNQEMEQRLGSQEEGVTALSNSLDAYLAPPDLPPG